MTRPVSQMFEGTYAPPFYLDLYNFRDGAQDDIFEDSYAALPIPGPNQTAVPVLADLSAAASSAVAGASTAGIVLGTALPVPLPSPSASPMPAQDPGNW
jgi:hypothetical protein